MKQSELFTKTVRENPKDEQSINAKLLIRGGFIDKLTRGVYSYLPMGLKVIKKIENIIRQEMNRIGGQEVLLPALHPKENWEKTGRWNVEEMFKLKGRDKREYSLGWTHEEIFTPLLQKFVSSYKDLPVFTYQIQDKFRDELRAKSGLLRGIEFLMKDMYSFHADEKDLDNFYEKVKQAYFQIFKRCGLEKETFLTYASGGTFSKYSHEFQTITSYGEDIIYLCDKCNLGINKEIIKEVKNSCPQCGNKDLRQMKSIEVGNIFKLKDKYSAPFNFKFKGKDGKEELVLMGCYGIGLGRLMGAVVEIHNDENGIIWTDEVYPFKVHILSLEEESSVKKEAEKLYAELKDKGIETLYDDRDKSAGEKFADADLIGIPYRIVVSRKTLESKSVEIKKRDESNAKLVNLQDILNYVR